MSGMIKVSVIIPVYNAEKYLAECLDSVLGQTLREIEIICVDDGSTDHSLKILREYGEKDGRLKIIEQANGGGGAARNAGMAAAQGEYLAFLDADDLYYPYALETALACAEKFHTDMVVFEADYFDDRQELLRTERVETECLAGVREFSAQTIPEFIFQIASCNTWDKLYKREPVQRTGLQYQKIRTANDLCFVYSAIACAEQIAVEKKSLVRHRILYRGNLQSVKVKTPLDFLAALEQLERNLRRFGLWEQLRQSYINCALFHCAHNWRTLDRPGKRQVAARGREIEALLELNEHSEQYYYNLHDYALICKVVGFSGKGGLRFMSKVKDLLKHILPPPVDAFNREMAGIKQYMRELNAGLESQQRQQYNELFDILERIQKQAVDGSRYASEAVWAEVYNNAVSGSKWLYDKSFAPGRWAVGYPYLYVMYRVLDEMQPKHILELGLGQSTKMIAQYCATNNGAEHYVVESDLDWVAFFSNTFKLPESSEVICLKYAITQYKEAERVRVFEGFEEKFAGKKFDFISIDAPYSADMKQYGRIDILSILPDCLSENFVIMIDDCQRRGETNTIGEIENKLREAGILYKARRYCGEKDIVLITANHMGFLTTM